MDYLGVRRATLILPTLAYLVHLCRHLFIYLPTPSDVGLKRSHERTIYVFEGQMELRQSKEGALIWHFCSHCPDWPMQNYRRIMDVKGQLTGTVCQKCKVIHRERDDQKNPPSKPNH